MHGGEVQQWEKLGSGFFAAFLTIVLALVARCKCNAEIKMNLQLS